MTITTLAFSAPLPSDIWTREHPVLQYYGAYGKDFGQNHATTQPDRYYAEDCKMFLPDLSIVEGGKHIWRYTGSELYGAFPKVTRDVLEFIVVSNDETRTHKVHIQLVTTLHTGKGKIDVPQAFMYTVGKADEGKGTNGLQFRELKCYYDRSLIEKAKANL